MVDRHRCAEPPRIRFARHRAHPRRPASLRAGDRADAPGRPRAPAPLADALAPGGDRAAARPRGKRSGERRAIVARGRVAVKNRDAELVLQLFDQLGDERAFSRTDRAHEIDGGDTCLIEQRAVFVGQLRIRFEQAVLQFDVVDFVWRRFQRHLYRTFVCH